MPTQQPFENPDLPRFGRNARSTNFDRVDPPGHNSQLEQGTLESVRRFLSDEDDSLDDIMGGNKGGMSSSTRDWMVKTTKPTPTRGKLNGSDMFDGISRSSRFKSDAGDSSPSTMLGDLEMNRRAKRTNHQDGNSQRSGQGIFSAVGDAVVSAYYTLTRPCYVMSEYVIASTSQFDCTRRTSTKQKLFCFSLMLLVALGLSAAVFTLAGEEDSHGDIQIDDTPEVIPTNPNEPSVVDEGEVESVGAPGDGERLDSIKDFILSSGISEKDDLNTDGSAQNKALWWISELDEAQLQVGGVDMLQRYALATLFFSTTSTNAAASTTDAATAAGGGLDKKMVEQDSKTWKNSENWMTTYHVCTWYGVDCSGNHNSVATKRSVPDGVVNPHVNHLNLTANNLVGTIPSEVSAMEKIRTIVLNGNALNGNIPEALGSLKLLAVLELKENQLTGTVPSEIAECKSLRGFHVDKNKLEGKIPTELTVLKDMRTLGLSENKFTGPLPVVTDFTHLRFLDLCSNEFTGTIPTEYGTLSGLVDVHLMNNKLHGAIPQQLGKLAHLGSVHLGNNTLSGLIPHSINGWKSVTEFWVNDNQITGKIPFQLAQVSNLEILHLEGNKMDGEIPPAMGKLEKLREFHFYHNEFTGTVPERFCDQGRPTKMEFLAGDCSRKGGTVTCECCDKCYP